MTEKSIKLSLQFAKEFKLTVEDVVELTGFNNQSIREWAHNGTIKAVKRFRRWYFTEKGVLEFIKSKIKYNQ